MIPHKDAILSSESTKQKITFWLLAVQLAAIRVLGVLRSHVSAWLFWFKQEVRKDFRDGGEDFKL